MPALLCILDTGIDLQHTNFKDKIVACKDFTSSKYGCDDQDGHGTHVADLALQEGAKKLIIAKVFGDSMQKYGSWGFNAQRWCRSLGGEFLNSSWGSPTKGTMTAKAVKQFQDEGGEWIASAGNRGRNTREAKRKYGVYWNKCSFPGLLPGVIMVGSMTSAGAVSSFTSEDCPKDHVWEDGHSERAAYPCCQYSRRCQDKPCSKTAVLSGTSMAAPKCAAKRVQGKECGKLPSP